MSAALLAQVRAQVRSAGADFCKVCCIPKPLGSAPWRHLRAQTWRLQQIHLKASIYPLWKMLFCTGCWQANAVPVAAGREARAALPRLPRGFHLMEVWAHAKLCFPSDFTAETRNTKRQRQENRRWWEEWSSYSGTVHPHVKPKPFSFVPRLARIAWITGLELPATMKIMFQVAPCCDLLLLRQIRKKKTTHLTVWAGQTESPQSR